jgi:hypothetical protein
MLNATQSAQEIVDQLVAECTAVLGRAPEVVNNWTR